MGKKEGQLDMVPEKTTALFFLVVKIHLGSVVTATPNVKSCSVYKFCLAADTASSHIEKPGNC